MFMDKKNYYDGLIGRRNECHESFYRPDLSVSFDFVLKTNLTY